MSLNVRGTIYSSITVFMKEHGFKRAQFNKVLNYEDGKDKYSIAAERLLKAKDEQSLKTKDRMISITVWRKKFDSIAEACRYFGVSESLVTKDIKRGVKASKSIINHVGLNQKEFERTHQKEMSLNEFLYQLKPPTVEVLNERKHILQANDRLYRFDAYQGSYRVS